MRLFKDSGGRKSWTVTLVVPAVVVLMAKFAVSGFAFGKLVMASMGPVEFGMAFASIVAPLVARDAVKTMYKTDAAPNGSTDQPRA